MIEAVMAFMLLAQTIASIMLSNAAERVIGFARLVEIQNVGEVLVAFLRIWY